jgi:hypothetical protein
MQGKRMFLQSGDMVYNAILDMMELQKGAEIFNDGANTLHFRVSIYGSEYGY